MYSYILMSFIIISPKFNKNNLLEIELQNNSSKVFQDIKLCFSLIYTIESLKGATILKQIGRYYELNLDKSSFLPNEKRVIFIKLQKSRIGTYNLSSGPEGIFIIDKEGIIADVKIDKLIFLEPIKQKTYEKNFFKINCPIVPEPKIFNLKNNNMDLANNDFNISDQEMQKFLTIMNPTLKLLNITFNSSSGIEINFIKEEMNKDDYKIVIETNSVEIFANDYGGKLYALITLIHLLFFYKKKLPIGEIEDNPKFNWRGMHLDCARQFHNVDQIKRLLIYMCLFKLNRFHWHLTDNEAWRLDLKSFPNLAKNSSFRGYECIIPPLYGSGHNKTGGYYTEHDVKNLIEFAAILNIEIMPEIDLPAHSWALIQIMPELFDQKSNIESQDVGNYKKNTINPSLDKTWNFLEKTIKEINNIFPFNIIHVGLDERPNLAWEGSPEMLKFMKKNNLESFGEVQDYYLNKVINIIKEKNKRTAAWNEAALPPFNDIGSGGGEGNIDKNCLIFAWEAPEVSSLAAKKGFQVVMCPGQKTYFDMAYNNSTYERGICWAATIEVSDVHAWKPLSIIDPKYHDFIIGIQGQLWSETITQKQYIDLMVNPRLATLAEVAWSKDNRRGWDDFRAALNQSMKILTTLGWKYHNF